MKQIVYVVVPLQEKWIRSRQIFFAYSKILENYKKEEHNGIRGIVSPNSKEDYELVKLFSNEGIIIRHAEYEISLNFALSNKLFYSTIGK